MKNQILIVLLLITFAVALQSQTIGSRVKNQEKRKLGVKVSSLTEKESLEQGIQNMVKHNTKIQNQNMDEFLQRKNKHKKSEETLKHYSQKNKGGVQKQHREETQEQLLQVNEQNKPLSLIQTRLMKSNKKCYCDPHPSSQLKAKVECPCQHGAKVECPCQHGAKVACPCQHGAKVECPCQHEAKVDCPCRGKNQLESSLLQIESLATSEFDISKSSLNVFLMEQK